MRRVLLSLGLIVVLLVAGFSAAAAETITFWQAGGNEQMITCMRSLISRFEQENPGITVRYQVIPWAEDPHLQYQTALIGGSMADVFSMGDAKQLHFAEAGYLEPLDQYISPALIADFSTATIERTSYNGQLIALPWYVSVRPLFYRKDLLAEENIPEPTTSWTWEEFVAYAKRLTKDTDGDGQIDQYGFGTSGQYVSQYQPFLRQNDADFVDEENWVATVDDPAAIEALQFYIDLIRQHKVVPPGISTIDLQDIQRMFANGRVAMFMDCEDTANAFAKEPELKDKFGVGLLPHNKSHAAFAGMDVISVWKGSQKKEAACKFAEFLMSEAAMAEYCNVSGFTPARAALMEDEAFVTPLRRAFMEQLQLGGFFYYASPQSSAFSRHIRVQVQRAIEGDQTVEEAASEIQRLLTRELERRR